MLLLPLLLPCARAAPAPAPTPPLVWAVWRCPFTDAAPTRDAIDGSSTTPLPNCNVCRGIDDDRGEPTADADAADAAFLIGFSNDLHVVSKTKFNEPCQHRKTPCMALVLDRNNVHFAHCHATLCSLRSTIRAVGVPRPPSSLDVLVVVPYLCKGGARQGPGGVRRVANTTPSTCSSYSVRHRASSSHNIHNHHDARHVRQSLCTWRFVLHSHAQQQQEMHCFGGQSRAPCTHAAVTV